ncbi:GldG family protein [Colwellia sp. Arc7-635]|uniref:GldG family protein n=1 Tax=Colwellia sp. Arc7-635 TaxID=2497879 RepID=UPI001F49F0DA|nr:GldG family protein [Colwellia sp. Arc7-635]
MTISNDSSSGNNNNNNESKIIFKHFFPALVGVMLFVFVLGLSLFYIAGKFNLLAFNLASCLTYIGAISLVVLLVVMKKLNRAEANVMTLTSGEASQSDIKQAFISRRWKKMLLVFTMVIGSLLFLSLSHYAANSNNTRWDVTQNKQHTLTQNTVNFISRLNEKVELTALYVGLPPKYLQDLFNEYERLSGGLISTQIIDPIDNISVAAKFGNVVNGSERKVIVQSSNGRKDVDFSDDALTEEKLTNAIARASSPARKVYFLVGHGEYSLSNEDNVGLSTFKQLLADNNIISDPLMLGITQAIPADCDVLVIAGARTALTKQEDSLIIDYLSAGGDALFLIENTLVTTPDKPLTTEQLQLNPSLNSLVNHWGLNVNSDIVVDLTNHVGDDVGSPATKNYQQHKAITEGLDYTFYVRPRSIEILAQRRANIKLAAIASTTSKTQSWAESNRNLAIEYNQETDTAGPVAISYVVLEEHKAKENKTLIESPYATVKPISDTRLIIFTDADFLTNVYINQYSNAQMGLNVVNWLAELDYQTFLNTKAVKVERLDLTSQQKRQVVVILFFTIFFFVIAGIVVWLQSKRR